MKDLNSHGYGEGPERHGEEVLGGLRPETPNRTTRSAEPSPSPGLVDATSDLVTGNATGVPSNNSTDNDQSPADDFTLPLKVTPVGPETTITNGNNDITSDTKSTNAPDIASSPPMNTNVVTGQDIDEQPSGLGQAVSVGDLPPPLSVADQQHFRSIIAGVTDGPIESEIETAEPEVAKPEDRPAASSAEDQQHFRSIITGVVEEPSKSEPETAEPEVVEQEVTEQEVTEHESSKSELPPAVPSTEDQQHFRSVIPGITKEPVKSELETTEHDVNKPKHLPPITFAQNQQHIGSAITVSAKPVQAEAEAMDQEITEPENDIASDSQVTDDGSTNIPVVLKQQASRSELVPPVENEEAEISGSNLVEARSTTASPLADRQQHVRSILAGVFDDETTEPKSTGMDATVPSTNSEETSLTPPFVTPMTFIDDVEPTYPETNETAHSPPTHKATANETKPLDAQDSTSP